MHAYPQLSLSPYLKESCKGQGSAPPSMLWPQHLPAHTQSQLLKDRPPHKHMPLPGSSLAKWRNTISHKTKLSVPVGMHQCTEVYLMACGGLGVCLRDCWKAHSRCSRNQEGTVAYSGTPLSIEV